MVRLKSSSINTTRIRSTTSAAISSSFRLFWNFSRRDDDDNDSVKNKHHDASVQFQENDKLDDRAIEHEEVAGSNKVGNQGIIAPFGENSPTLSPLLILPTTRKPIFPGFMSAITLKNESIIHALIEGKVSHPNYVGVFLRKEESTLKIGAEIDNIGDLITSSADLYNVGTFAQVQNIVRTEAGAQLILMGHRRINLKTFTTFGPPAIAEVVHWKRRAVAVDKSTLIKAQTNEVLNVARELIKMSPLLQEQLQLHNWVTRIDLNDPSKLADFATALTTAEGYDLQRVLESEDIEERLMIVLELLAKEKELAKLQKEISRQVEEKVSKQQREYFLREQLKSIKKVCL